MSLRTAKIQPPLHMTTQFSAWLAMLLGAALVAVIGVVFTTRPQLRNTAAWMPYDITKELKITGIVEDFWAGQCPWCGPGPGAHLLLRTADGPVEVHLAKAKFLRDHGYVFIKGDRVEVLGAKLIYDGGWALLAREVTRGGHRIVLRDARGIPVWLIE